MAESDDPTDGPLLWECVERWAREKPDAEAAVAGDRRIEWRQLADEIDRAAEGLLAAGLEPGDRVAMIAAPCPEYLVLLAATTKVGGVFLGLSAKFPAEENRRLLAHAEPKVLVVLASYAGADLTASLPDHRAAVPAIVQVVVIGETAPPDAIEWSSFIGPPRPERSAALKARAEAVQPDDPMLLLYTSGSTGRPKGVLHSHRAVGTSVRVERRMMGIGLGNRLLLHFPINHVAATVEIAAASLIGGGTLVLMDHFDPEESLETIERERITSVGQVPVMYLLQMQSPRFRSLDWRLVRSFVWGGSKASPVVLGALGQIAAVTGARLMTAYGSTELCGFTTYTAAEDPPDVLATTCGRVVEPFELRVVDALRRPVPPGTIGELAFRGPVVMLGYFRDPEATAAVIDREGWYHTGDLGSLDADGRLRLAGRVSEMFKSGGENVYPREVEDVLESHPDVLFAAVLGVPDPVYDEVGHAFVMPKPGRQLDLEGLREHCRAHLVNFKVPKLLEERPMLPLLANGKVDKRSLRASLARGPV
jgi:acyl-CoA synthetase (AMP-forming)/AMP-acid ligase II